VVVHAVTGLAARERVRAFDLAAGLAVFFMILVHVLWNWGRPDTATTPIGELISFAAGPTATPVFLFLVGASFGAAARGRTATQTLVVRGLWLFFLGYVLNVVRGVIPGVLGITFGVVTQEQIQPFTPWWLATMVDLHHVVGLSLIAIALLRTRLEPSMAWLALAGVLVLVAPWARSLEFGTPLLDAPLTPILSSAPNVFYALIPWLAYPLVGAVFGRAMARTDDRRWLFRRGALIGVGLLAAGLGLVVATRPGFDVVTYWHHPPALAVGILGIVLVWLALCDVVTRVEWIDRRLTVVYGWSHRVIAMYFTHWIIVGWGVGIVGFHVLDLPQVLLAIAAAVLATSYLSRFAVRLEARPWFRGGHAPASEIAVDLEPATA
jgi:uncharacterized membrane protein